MTGEGAIYFSLILSLAGFVVGVIILYFIIKTAVKNGINESSIGRTTQSSDLPKKDE